MLKVSTCIISPSSHGKGSTVMHRKFIRVISFVPFKNFMCYPLMLEIVRLIGIDFQEDQSMYS